MIPSQLEVIAQGQSYLTSVSTQDYISIASPMFISSAGAHIRHILDHYLAIMSGITNGCIDYDCRDRGNFLEQDPILANEKFSEISLWIKTIPQRQLQQNILLTTEISLSQTKIHQVKTSIERELVFVASHAVHHFAMIKQISLYQNMPLTESFGIAPATASYFRQLQ